ncbi:TetR/AcrR family transcriptional regulator [Sphingobium sp. H39-3-25]|uniref:TetR family transcriptional regulator C-terminal domain-containing protein n=1 Tax=Sphingobium arseniciresistens TaxID=3030834 RepID=UPI0023BA3700|nr:TetR/AcrR family transcriptional regulator [Sphingobium arseniciresistens]
MKDKESLDGKKTRGPSRGSGRKVPKSSVGASPKGSARRDEILNGLMDKIAGRELHNPSLREIGRALGIEPGHILYYFSSREDLLQSVIVHWDEEARRNSLEKSNSSLDNFAEQIRRNIDIPGIVHLYLNFAAEAINPMHPAREFFRGRFERVSATLESRIRQEQVDGIIADSVDAARAARQLIALADGLQLQSLVNPNVNAADDLKEAISSLRTPSSTAVVMPTEKSTPVIAPNMKTRTAPARRSRKPQNPE